MKFGRTALALAAVAGIAGLGGFAAATPKRADSGWGIDACLSAHVGPAAVTPYLDLLSRSGIQWLRERSLGPPFRVRSRPSGNRLLGSPVEAGRDTAARRVWRREKAAGFRVLAFASTFARVPVADPANQLPENLLEVYRAAFQVAASTAGEVDAWEMVGEPETFYCRDLPERVAAYQKAVYLGLKDGSTLARSGGAPGVLMGALAFPPGPWLQAAAENGWFDYTDAINVHHYGFARDFRGLIAAHRAFAQRWTGERRLAVWVTEAGLNNIPKGDWRNVAARSRQADYLIECAKGAIAERVAVFMPFVLTWRNSPFAMTERATDPHPSWERYRDFTLQNSLRPDGPSLAPPPSPSRVVLQWLPDPDTCTPSKISRAYWFEEDGEGGVSPMAGEIRAYNLGSDPVRVRLSGGEGLEAGFSLEWPEGKPAGWVTIAPQSFRTFPLRIRRAGAEYGRTTITFAAETPDRPAAGPGSSRLSFTAETMPSEALAHRTTALNFGPCPGDFAFVGGEAPFVPTSRDGRCLGIDGVIVRESSDPGEAVFDVHEANVDTQTPPMAIFSLPRGLPTAGAGYLRLTAVDGDGRPAFVRVDLVDSEGQRFSIVEGLGRTPGVSTGDSVLLAYRDFHPWVFGRPAAGGSLDPARVRELQLRFTGAEKPRRFRIRLEAIDFAPRS